MAQLDFIRSAKSQRGFSTFSHSSGGILRRRRNGRTERRLSTRHSLHLVFKLNREAWPKGFRHPSTWATVRQVLRQYSRRFFVKIDQVAIERDHIHLIIRASKRENFQSFFKVVAGQISQRVTGTSHTPHHGPKFWIYRPFSRVVKAWRDLLQVRNYVRLNELEACGKILYQKGRLKGLSKDQVFSLLWTYVNSTHANPPLAVRRFVT